ncbi:hypothetical protein ACIBFB_22370 [Nocardiopsis sp. NPDC050513]
MPEISTIVTFWFLIQGWYRHMASEGPDVHGVVAAVVGVVC